MSPDNRIDDLMARLEESVNAAKAARKRQEAKRSVTEAERQGYTVDRHCYPWVAYKGPRFSPDEWFHLDPQAMT